jgi:type I restriction enzyme S subunit
VHQNHIIKVRFKHHPIERWTLAWLLSPGGRRAIERVASSTSGLHTLSISKVGNLPVPLPPDDEQARILDSVERALSIVDASAAGIERAFRRCNRLRQAVLKWAFEGKLVDQDRVDEPADELLARIRGERAVAVSAKTTTRARARRLKTAS